MSPIGAAERAAILADPDTPQRIAALIRAMVRLSRADRAAGNRARARERLVLARRLRALALYVESAAYRR